MKNEWDLLLEARRSADAGEARACFVVLSPPRWTLFSGRTARVQAPDGTTYELGPDFSAVLHELIREHINTQLVWQMDPPCYELCFRPGQRHPSFDPTQNAGREEPPTAGISVSPGSPQALRSFLDALPPDEPDPAPDDDGNGHDGP